MEFELQMGGNVFEFVDMRNKDWKKRDHEVAREKRSQRRQSARDKVHSKCPSFLASVLHDGCSHNAS